MDGCAGTLLWCRIQVFSLHDVCVGEYSSVDQECPVHVQFCWPFVLFERIRDTRASGYGKISPRTVYFLTELRSFQCVDWRLIWGYGVLVHPPQWFSVECQDFLCTSTVSIRSPVMTSFSSSCSVVSFFRTMWPLHMSHVENVIEYFVIHFLWNFNLFLHLLDSEAMNLTNNLKHTLNDVLSSFRYRSTQTLIVLQAFSYLFELSISSVDACFSHAFCLINLSHHSNCFCCCLSQFNTI